MLLWNIIEFAGSRKEKFSFHHISTDEVFGSLGE
jgi:dTDP-D-glucose 4,6-dehydratase